MQHSTNKPHRDLRSQAYAHRFLDLVRRKQGKGLKVWKVQAHGNLVVGADGRPTHFVVPQNVLVVFQTLPGEVCWVKTDRVVQVSSANLTELSMLLLKGLLPVTPYRSMYVPGDRIPDLQLDFVEPDFAMAVANNQKMFAPRHSETTLSKTLKTHGPGVYMVQACRVAPNVNRATISRLQQVDLLARARFQPVWDTKLLRMNDLAQLVAPDLPSGENTFSGKHLSFALDFPFIRKNVNQKRKNRYHGATRLLADGKLAVEDYRGRTPFSPLAFLRRLSQQQKQPSPSPNKPPSQTPTQSNNRLLRKYGFDTPNEARALRLYIHHKARALAAAKQHEIDRAFDMRRSRPR